MASALIWMFIFYFLFVRKKMLKCPHCEGNGISASKKFLLGPIFRPRCNLCNGRWRTSYWNISLGILFIPLVVAVAIMDVLDMLPWFTPDFILIPIIWSIYFFTILYVVPVVKK